MRVALIAAALLVAWPLALGAEPADPDAPPPERQTVQQPAPPAQADGDKNAAERLFRLGQRAYRTGRFAEAAQAMEAAYREWDSPDIAFSAAQAHRLHFVSTRDQRSLARAAELYRVYLRRVPQGGRRSDAALNLAELEPLLRDPAMEGAGAAPAQKEVTRLGISSSASGAEVSLDGRPFAPVPVFAEVDPGKHEYRVRAPGHKSRSGDVQAFAGQFDAIEVELEPLPARVSVSTERGAEIYVDGGRAPRATGITVAPGRHRIDVVKRGRQLVTIERDFERDSDVELEADLAWTGRRKIAVGLMATSAVVATLAIGTGVAALDAHLEARDLDDARDRRGLSVTERDRYNELLEDRDDRVDVTLVLGGVGAAVAAGGLLVYFFDSPEPDLAPAITTRGVGVQGRF